MRNKQKLITYSYHFLNEAAILFLLAIPFLHFEYDFVPYRGYILTIIGISILYTVYLNYIKSYAIYILTAPLIGVLFLLLNYPTFIWISFPVLLTWRALVLRSESEYKLNRENRHILIMFILAFFLFIVVKDYLLIVFVGIQLFILFAGYMSSHFSVIKRSEIKQVDKKLPLYTAAVLILGVTAIFPLFNAGRYLLRMVWEGFAYVLILVISQIVRLFEFIEFNRGETPSESGGIEVGEDADYYDGTEMPAPLIDEIGYYLYWGTLIIILSVVVYIAIRMIGRKFNETKEAEENSLSTYDEFTRSSKKGKNLFQRLYSNFLNRSNHPVRKLLYQFELQMIDTTFERRTHETIEHWTSRIGLPTNLEAYQKVRYGGMDINKEEIEQLKQELETFTSQTRLSRD